MVDAWLLFTLMIPFAEVLLHTRMEQLKQKFEELEKRIVTMKNSKEITKNQVQPISESQSTTTPSMVMPLDGIINAWEANKDKIIKKLRYTYIYFSILSYHENHNFFYYFSKKILLLNSKKIKEHSKNIANFHPTALDLQKNLYYIFLF